MYLQFMDRHTHIIIVGGGLAGLTSAIHLAKYNIPVMLIEKDTYPKHKVCGEYISNEVVPYLKFLGIQIDDLNPVQISNLHMTTTKGKMISSELPLGGFGISRYALDHFLWKKAKELGVQLLQDQVLDITYDSDTFRIDTFQSYGSFT